MNKVLKDPVCRMVVHPDNGLTLSYAGYTVHFCSEYCQKKFRECPDRYFGHIFWRPGHDEAKENGALLLLNGSGLDSERDEDHRSEMGAHQH